MSVEASDLRGLLILKNLEKRQQARAILGAEDKPMRSTLQLASVAFAAGVTGYFVGQATVARSIDCVMPAIAAGLVGICFEVSRLRRRLDAVVALIDLESSSPDE